MGTPAEGGGPEPTEAEGDNIPCEAADGKRREGAVAERNEESSGPVLSLAAVLLMSAKATETGASRNPFTSSMSV